MKVSITYCASEKDCWNPQIEHRSLGSVELPLDIDDPREGWVHLALVPR